MQRQASSNWPTSARALVKNVKYNGTHARVEAFLADILALEGENPDAIREGVQVALADCTDISCAAELILALPTPSNKPHPAHFLSGSHGEVWRGVLSGAN